MKENVDNVDVIWKPDPVLCQQAEEYRQEKEWLRKKTGTTGMKPSELGIESYIYGNALHPKFYEGRTPPPVPIDSYENIEWYEDQLKRCVFGFEWKGQRISGDLYWLLNFSPFLVAQKDKNGKVTKEFEVSYPYYSQIQDYMFKLIEEAHMEGKAFMLMSGRGIGKSYGIMSILNKIYHVKPRSHNVVSASNSIHSSEAFSKVRQMINSTELMHPTLALARAKDSATMIESGHDVTRDGVKYEEGPRSKIQQIIYGDNPGITRGSTVRHGSR